MYKALLIILLIEIKYMYTNTPANLLLLSKENRGKEKL